MLVFGSRAVIQGGLASCARSRLTWKKRRVSPPLQPGRSYATASRFSDSCTQLDGCNDDASWLEGL